MKITVSIPDKVFAEAESPAQRLKTSRSELYSRALTGFVGHHAPERVTEQMNQVVTDVGEARRMCFAQRLPDEYSNAPLGDSAG